MSNMVIINPDFINKSEVIYIDRYFRIIDFLSTPAIRDSIPAVLQDPF